MAPSIPRDAFRAPGPVPGGNDGGKGLRRVASALLIVAAATATATAAPQRAPAPASAPARSPGQPDRQLAADLGKVIATQIAARKGEGSTATFSKGLKSEYDAAAALDGDNLGESIFGSAAGDVPDKVVKVSGATYDGNAAPPSASIRATLHFVNPDAQVRSFDRDVVVSFVKENGQWRIDDVRLVGSEAPRGREIWIRRGLAATLADASPAGPAKADAACARPVPGNSSPDWSVMGIGFKPLQIAPREGDANRATVAEKFVSAIGANCPFAYQLADLNGDGLSDLVIQMSDRKLGATDDGLRRTAVYVLDRQGRWQPAIDGLARGVLARTDRSGNREVAMVGSEGQGYRVWRWVGNAFAPVADGGR